MAKYEITLKADFDELVQAVEKDLWAQSTTLSLEEESDMTVNGIRIRVAVYERYAWGGGNRASLSITFVGEGEDVTIIGIGAGGSSAMFFKVNTWSESNFLDTLIFAVENYKNSRGL